MQDVVMVMFQLKHLIMWEVMVKFYALMFIQNQLIQ